MTYDPHDPVESAAYLANLRELFARVTYMPGWNLEVRDPLNFQDPFPVLVLRATLEDATKPGTKGPVVRVVPIPSYLFTDDQLFGEWLRAVLINAWAHEVDEWLRIDGRYVKDPHPELRQESPCPR